MLSHLAVFADLSFQNSMVLRHHHEAESLHAIQKMDWENATTSIDAKVAVDSGFIPTVRVTDDFSLELDR